MVSLRQLCTALDAFEPNETFTKDDLVTRSGMSGSGLAGILPGLISRGLLVKLPGTKPFRYQRAMTSAEAGGPTYAVSAVEAHDSGGLANIWSRAKPADNGARQAAEEPPEPEEEDIEVDPFEILDALEPEQFSQVITDYVRRAQAMTIPLTERLAMTENNLMEAQRDLEQSRNDAARVIAELRNQVKDEREKNMELRNQMAYENERRVIPEAPVKVLVKRETGQPPQRQSGGSTGAPRSTVVIHRKPRMEHAPKSAREAINRDR